MVLELGNGPEDSNTMIQWGTDWKKTALEKSCLIPGVGPPLGLR